VAQDGADELGEEAFNEIEPGAVFGRERKLEANVSFLRSMEQKTNNLARRSRLQFHIGSPKNGFPAGVRSQRGRSAAWQTSVRLIKHAPRHRRRTLSCCRLTIRHQAV
jgi:hypothetical protein